LPLAGQPFLPTRVQVRVTAPVASFAMMYVDPVLACATVTV
jgi:hypothetical protein